MKQIMCCLFFALALPAISWAGGTYVPGYVGIGKTTTGSTVIGFWNVRYNPAVTTGYIAVESTINYVSITATGSNGSGYFSCTTFSDSPYFLGYQRLLANAGNGTYLSVKAGLLGQCDSITKIQSSSMLD
jgi:hypothetical protein